MVDLRIGLSILGHDGARILYEYLRVSRHREEWRRTGQDPFELGKIAGGAYARRASEGETDRELRLRVEEAFSFYEKALGWKETDLVRFYNGYDKEYAAYQKDKSLE